MRERHDPRERPMLRLFHGENRTAWEKRMADRGWPYPIAWLLSRFIVGETPLPHCPAELLQTVPLTSEIHRTMEAYHRRCAELLEAIAAIERKE